jgi:dCTP deaminase
LDWGAIYKLKGVLLMMLSDRDLYKLAVENNLLEPFIPDNCEGATVNLTLDPIIKKYISNEPIVLGKEVTEDHYETIDLTKQDFMLQPTQSVLIQTHEFIRVPVNMSARIYERYGVKSLGLMISPAHYMNPGFRGKISLVAINHSPVPVRLIPGIKICQVALFRLSSDAEKPYDRQDALYMDARDVSISKLHLDKQIQEFLTIKGIQKVSDKMASELGDHLMSHVKKSAKRLADILRREEGKLKDEPAT